MLRQMGFQADTVIGQIQEAFIHKQAGSLSVAYVQDSLQKRCNNHLPGGVIGIAEEKHIRAAPLQHRKERFRQGKLILFFQWIPLHRAADPFQCQGILRKRRRQLHGPPGPEGFTVGVNQFRRAVAAKNPVFGDGFKVRDGLHQLPAVGIGVLVNLGQHSGYGVPNGLGRSVRVGVGREIQADLPVINVSPVGIDGVI